MVELRERWGPIHRVSLFFHSFPGGYTIGMCDVFELGPMGQKPQRWALFGSDSTRVSISNFTSIWVSLSLSWAPYSTCLPRLHVTTFKHKLYNDIWMKEREEIGYILILNKFCYSSLIELGSKSMVITFI